MKKPVYWAPWDPAQYKSENDWNILYPEPESVYENLIAHKTTTKENNIFSCPSFQNLMKNTYLFKSPMSMSAKIISDDEIKYNSLNYIDIKMNRVPRPLKNRICISLSMSLIFFSEESINMSVTAPYFHNSKISQYASIAPGVFDIGKWFRPVNLEYFLWPNNDSLEMVEDEPMLYVNFNSEEQVVLKRFEMDETLLRISNICSTAGRWEKKTSLQKRYQKFIKSKTNKIVLNHIKNRLV